MDLGCFPHCGKIYLPLVARFSGIHRLEYYYGCSIYYMDFAAKCGEPLCFENRLNESGCQKFKIIEPGGNYYTYYAIAECLPDKENKDFFKVETKISYSLDVREDVCKKLFDICKSCEDDCNDMLCNYLTGLKCSEPIVCEPPEPETVCDKLLNIKCTETEKCC